MFIYNLDKAVGTPSNVCDQDHGRYFSLLNPDGSPTQAYLALKAMAKPDVDYVPTPTATPTPTPTPTPTWAPTEVSVPRSSGAQLSSNNQAVGLSIPPFALPTSVANATLRFAPAAATPTPAAPPVGTPTAVPASAIFEVSVRNAANGTPVSNLAAPLTLTVRYDQGPDFVEDGLALYRRPSVDDGWTTAGILTQTVDTASKLVAAQVITLSQFVLLGPPSQRAFLPVAIRSYGGGW